MRMLGEIQVDNRVLLDNVQRQHDATINAQTGEFFNPVMQSVVDVSILLDALELAAREVNGENGKAVGLLGYPERMLVQRWIREAQRKR